MEKTFVMLKPDALQRHLVGQIISRIESKGYKITQYKSALLTEDLLREHYAHIVDKPFFPQVLEYMTSGPVLLMKVEGENVVLGIRKLMGATKFENAEPGTIRGDFALSTEANVIHGSDSVENAEIELKRFLD
ncbi:MAG: nucleoside-diphosphate kinase [Clostridia bacterium]|nr:nucleoside-diphosphate kinase [Clostridia bacterium]